MDKKIINLNEYKAAHSDLSEDSDEYIDVFEHLTEDEISEIMMELIEAFDVQDEILLTPANDDGDISFSVYFIDEDDDEDNDYT